ncbi:alpha/beta hydrolase-fold protein [Sphingomonas alpina]|uniref:Esterase n=1 Tax=Sphingomonas alpina TaxID=653931 RepID=A0A7H0LFU4_9SPHN|nr:alpha/beta hydrolase-fold protein [Sphingomonas alpina]QNQ08547.1 hypothetical protein H3Z74_17605 [Sphingomonas alpina]
MGGRNGIKLGLRAFLACIALTLAMPALAQVRFSVTLPGDAKTGPVTGRLIVVAASSDTAEPRLVIGMNGPPSFGVDVDALKPGGSITVGQESIGYPIDLKRLPPGDYNIQAVLIRYVLAKRSDGHTIWVPSPNPQRAPAFMSGGNLYSKPIKVKVAPTSPTPIALSLTETIPPPEPFVDTPWLKHVRIKSKILSDFWGIPMTIGATVLLPKGFDEHPDARYPTVYALSHGDVPFGFDTDPATDTERARAGAADGGLKTGYQFSQEWQGDLPRFVAITLEQFSPYFFESYVLNSANNGPWGDAITKELMPYLEKKFRLIDQPYGRITEGASTGGWESLALLLHYPDKFGGAWVFNPDPIDFSRYQLTDVYKDVNMFEFRFNDWQVTDRPFRRTREGQPGLSVRDLSKLEAMLGSKGRGYYQLAIWQSTYGPVGKDGYPVPLFDPLTGVIDHEVAEYSRRNGYDLTDYARTNWATLGPKLAGRMNFFAGEQDDFFLNLGVYKFQEMVAQVAGADYPIRFEYGRPKKGHNWHHTDWAGVIREMAAHVRKTAPAGAPLTEWNY